jgi:hypothetical protein
MTEKNPRWHIVDRLLNHHASTNLRNSLRFIIVKVANLANLLNKWSPMHKQLISAMTNTLGCWLVFFF